MHQQEPRSEGQLAGGAGELHATRQLRTAAVGVKHSEGVRLDVRVELVLDHDVDKDFGSIREHAADVVPVEAVEEVAPILQVDCQWVRVEPVVYPLSTIISNTLKTEKFQSEFFK